ICDEGLAFINDDGEEGTVPLGREGCEATRFFDGARTLAEAAVALGIELEIAQQNSTSIAKEAFLQLVKHDAYHPNDPHLPYSIPEEDQYA
ncbi:MAG: hypothetical protein KAI66_28180, partial [Lentisphaeria bacterium]|nr:hypothetical protein [Lentisphaeria bacterium]